jgi:hypothetical protein
MHCALTVNCLPYGLFDPLRSQWREGVSED